MIHDKISFTREYCQCRRIPYKISKEQLNIRDHEGNSWVVCFSLYNLTYYDILRTIDQYCLYNSDGFFAGINSNSFYL